MYRPSNMFRNWALKHLWNYIWKHPRTLDMSKRRYPVTCSWLDPSAMLARYQPGGNHANNKTPKSSPRMHIQNMIYWPWPTYHLCLIRFPSKGRIKKEKLEGLDTWTFGSFWISKCFTLDHSGRLMESENKDWICWSMSCNKYTQI